MSLPLKFFAYIFIYFKLDNIDTDLKKSLEIIDKYSDVEIDKEFVEILIIAEDRRNKFHYGIDPIAILRAIKIKILKNTYQGASTIEQQFVRVVSNRYERTFYRKFREQLLAILLCKNRKKDDISKAYLLIAYYGYNLEGIFALKKLCLGNIKSVNSHNIVEIISRLKYPQPKKLNDIWLKKHNIRNIYINELLKKQIFIFR